MQITSEDNLILSTVKTDPSTTEINKINNLIAEIQEWDYLISTIIDRGLGPIFYKKLALHNNNTLIPEQVKNKLHQSYLKTLTRSMILHNAFQGIMKAFNAQNISVIALKGIYLSEWLYGDIGLRQFSDIDLLVKEEDGLKCLAVLADLGYKPADTKESDFVKEQVEIVHFTPMVLNGVSIEIHIKLHRQSEKYNLPVESLFSNAISTTINNTPTLALSLNDLMIHLCVHLDKHFKVGQVQFTCFMDITNLLEKCASTINWNTLIETCRIYKCEEVVLKYVILVNNYMNATVPSEIVHKYQFLLTEKDIHEFFEYLSGNFVPFSAVPHHLVNLKKQRDLINKFRYALDIIFPSKAFMLQKYSISDKRLVINDKQKVAVSLPWWLWYPYRWWVGLKGVVRLIMKSQEPRY